MRGILIGAIGATVVVVALMAQGNNNPNPKPTCNMCPGYYIPLSELQAYTKKAIDEKLVDQQVRDIEIGKAHIGIGMPCACTIAPAPKLFTTFPDGSNRITGGSDRWNTHMSPFEAGSTEITPPHFAPAGSLAHVASSR